MANSSGLSITAQMPVVQDPAAMRHMVKVDTASLEDGRGLSRFMPSGQNKDGGSSAAMMGNGNKTTMMRSDGMV